MGSGKVRSGVSLMSQGGTGAPRPVRLVHGEAHTAVRLSEYVPDGDW
jgi:hypothetical protein